VKPIEEFAWRRIKRGQRDNMCAPCRSAYGREHYLANRQRYIDAEARRKRARAETRMRYLIEYFRSHPCTDCGEKDPLVLEFDHLRDKRFEVTNQFASRNWQEILDEIAKCEVVCANCHRRRTARERGSIRALLSDAA
jgi:5-methylcytosine-specific restriction endonuclease McrA